MPEMLKLGLEEPLPRGNAGYQLEVGSVIGRSFSVTWANLGSFYLVGLAVTSPALLILLMAAVLPVSEEGTRLLITVSDLVDRLLSLVLPGALAYAVIQHLRGRTASVGQTVAVGLRNAGRVFLVSFLAGLATMVGLLLCVVPGIIVACMLWVAVPVAVVEQAGIQESMDRSQALTLGTRTAVFAVSLLMGLIVGAMSLAIYGGAGATVALLGSSEGHLASSRLAAGQLVGSLLQLPLQCLGAVSAAVGYHDLRVHREGADVEDLVTVFE